MELGIDADYYYKDTEKDYIQEIQASLKNIFSYNMIRESEVVLIQFKV